MRSTCRHHRRGPGSPATWASARCGDLVVGGVRRRGGDLGQRLQRPGRDRQPRRDGAGLLERRQRRVDAAPRRLDGAERPPPQRRRSGGPRRRCGWARRQRRTTAGSSERAATSTPNTMPTAIQLIGAVRRPSSSTPDRSGRSAARTARLEDRVERDDRRRRRRHGGRLAGGVTAVAGRRRRVPTRPGPAPRRCSSRRRARRGPGVGSNGTQPRPSNQISGQAWAFLPSTERRAVGLQQPGRVADGDAGRDAERSGPSPRTSRRTARSSRCAGAGTPRWRSCCGPAGRRGCTGTRRGTSPAAPASCRTSSAAPAVTATAVAATDCGKSAGSSR